MLVTAAALGAFITGVGGVVILFLTHRFSKQDRALVDHGKVLAQIEINTNHRLDEALAEIRMLRHELHPEDPLNPPKE